MVFTSQSFIDDVQRLINFYLCFNRTDNIGAQECIRKFKNRGLFSIPKPCRAKSKSKSIPESEFATLNSLNTQYNLNWNLTGDVCSNLKSVIGCDQQNVISLTLHPSNQSNSVYLIDIKNLTQLEEIHIYSGYIIASSYWQDTIYTLERLKSFYCYDKCFNSLPTWINVTASIPSNIFYSNIRSLSLPNLNDNVALPILDGENDKIVYLHITNTIKSIPQSYTQFKNLRELEVYSSNSTITFNSFDQFEKLEVLYLKHPKNSSKSLFPSSIQQSKSLKKINPSLFQTLSYPSFIHGSNLTSIDLQGNDLKTFKINIFSFNEVSLKRNNIAESMPNGNYSVFKSLNIMHNNIVGTVPEGLCRSFETSLSYNNFTGPVPDCWLCSPYLVAPYVLPNNFSNYQYPIKKLGCQSFEIYDYNQSISTMGGSIIIEGKDFGWTSVRANSASLPLVVLVPNNQLAIKVPAGTGRGYTTSHWFDDNQILYNFTYGYLPPVVDSIVILDDNETSIFISGSNYGINSTLVTLSINNVQHEIQFINHTLITIPRDSELGSGQEILITLLVDGQSFNATMIIQSDFASPSISIYQQLSTSNLFTFIFIILILNVV
ncbi:putative cell surface glycoprotein [Cavenderia fasciculata]|uniref:Cell surface glycoprotein n=1 Tax=Cavenderia fasciculata TaxID=261658 RepID=F4PP86_CACFS|nr:putative cell surface glycoprotein [Cavenderia fasciculata]EGG22199.1 putative cell surface glycoprotein [Cavenderia fasciculata]|eukprot:XP_004360050.1 putative cell surface glycoprotein [Cavenderia fasciculata]